MCKLLCTLATGSNADGFCTSSDPVVWLCSGGWGLVSFVAQIAWCRWQGDHSSARDEPITPPIAEPPDLLGAYDASAASRADK